MIKQNNIWWMAWITEGFTDMPSQHIWVATEDGSTSWAFYLN